VKGKVTDPGVTLEVGPHPLPLATWTDIHNYLGSQGVLVSREMRAVIGGLATGNLRAV